MRDAPQEIRTFLVASIAHARNLLFRNSRPRMLILWGKNDPFFAVEAAKAYLRDLPKAELHLIETGHFALEDSSGFIAERIRQFLS